MANPYWDILGEVKTILDAVSGIPTTDIREVPYLVAGDSAPIVFICPTEQGEQIVRETFKRGVVFEYPVLIAMIHASNRLVKAGLEAKLQLRHDIRRALFNMATGLPDGSFDLDCNPQQVTELGAYLGTNYSVSGFLMLYRRAERRTG